MNKSQLLSKVVECLSGLLKSDMTKPENHIANLLVESGYARWIEVGTEGEQQFCRHKKAVK